MAQLRGEGVMKELTHVSLFSGIGGIDLAAEWAGFKTVCFVEIDDYCQKVLRKHWPSVPIIGDIKDVTKETVENARSRGFSKQDICSQQQGRAEVISTSQSGLSDNRAGIIKRQTHTNNSITLITGGFPCQPVSTAGKRRGKEDDRWLWPEMLRVISEIRPTWVVAENVTGLLNMGFNDCISDLESIGYETTSFLIPACGVNAPHRRDRIFIVGYAINSGSGIGVRGKQTGQEIDEGRQGLPQPKPCETGDAPNTIGTDGRGGGVIGEASNKRGRASKGGGKGLQSRNGTARSDNTQPGSEDVANTDSPKRYGGSGDVQVGRSRSEKEVASDNHFEGTQWSIESRLGRMVDGISYWSYEPDGIPRVAKGIKNRVDRLKCLGNAVVPQQIYPILKAIADVETNAERKTVKASESKAVAGGIPCAGNPGQGQLFDIRQPFIYGSDVLAYHGGAMAAAIPPRCRVLDVRHFYELAFQLGDAFRPESWASIAAGLSE